MSSKVVLQALDSRTFKLALRDVRFAKFNEKLTGLEPENWRLLLSLPWLKVKSRRSSLPVRRPPGPSTLRSPSSPSSRSSPLLAELTSARTM